MNLIEATKIVDETTVEASGTDGLFKVKCPKCPYVFVTKTVDATRTKLLYHLQRHGERPSK